jgi:hypothetical protein
MSDDELAKELATGGHDEAARMAILGEMIRRGARERSRPNWLQWLTLAVALGAAILAGIAAYPVLDDGGPGRWFDF